MICELTYKHLEQVAHWGCLFALLFFSNCNGTLQVEEPEITLDGDGVVISNAPIWESDVSAEWYISAGAIPIFHKDKVVVAGNPAREKGMLAALDLETGEEVWRWTDYVDGYDFEEVLSFEQLNRKDNVVIYNDNNRFCAVDLDNGTTLWNDKREGSSPSSLIQIAGDHYYFPFELIENDVGIQTLMRGSIYSADYEQLVELPIERLQLFLGFYGTFYAPLIYTENGSTHAFLAFSENVDLYKGQSFNSYISYNISDETYDFQKIRIPGIASDLPVTDRPDLIGEIVILNADESIFGINKHTGEIVWSRKDFRGNGDGAFVTAAYKDRFFAVNRIGFTDRVMELDPSNGNTRWIDEGRGGSSHPSLHFLNDVMYFISRGDERLYAYDINGGKLLWKLRSPDDEGFTVMQVREKATPDGEDVLVACTWKNAYRFEPAQTGLLE